jgi:hypothetical protein
MAMSSSAARDALEMERKRVAKMQNVTNMVLLNVYAINAEVLGLTYGTLISTGRLKTRIKPKIKARIKTIYQSRDMVVRWP